MSKGGAPFFSAPQKDVDAVKFWAAGRLNELSALHQSYDDVDALLRTRSDDDVVLALMEVVGQSDEALQFIEQLLTKRRQLIDGSSAAALTHSQDGMVAYQKDPLATRGGAPKKQKQPKKDKQPAAVAAAPKGKSTTGPPREECYCMGAEHPVLGNCLSCGKIICEYEGKGLPCLFCGELFVGSVGGGGGGGSALQEAVARKNALLEYERKSVARSLIYDDQADYFNSESQWMSQAEKTKMREKEREAREKKEQQKHRVRMALDIFGRRMVVCEDETANQSIYQPFDLSDVLPKETDKKQEKAAAKAEKSAAALKPSYQGVKPDKKKAPQSAEALAAAADARSGKRIQHSYFEVEESVPEAVPASATFAVSGIVFDGCAVVPQLVPAGVTRVGDAALGEKEGVVRVKLPLSRGFLESEQTRAVLLDLSACDAIVGEQFNTLAKYHAHLVAEVAEVQALRKTPLDVWLLPLHSRLRVDGDYSAVRKYWNELNEMVRKNVAFVVTTSLEEHPLVTTEHVGALKKLFGDKRQLIVLDSVKTPFAVYSGRAPNLDVKGMLVAFRGEHPKALSVPLRCALAFQANPQAYDAVESFKQAVAEAMGQSVSDCREVPHLLRIVLALPRSQAELNVALKELQSKRRRQELAESIQFVRQSSAVKQWLGDEMSVLEQSLLLPLEKLSQKPK
jgi:uncharacterized protein with NAD-binding domain and iron-sulfur cluster